MWLVLAVAALLAVAVTVVLLLAAVPVVTVTGIYFTSADNACGANDNLVNITFSMRATASQPVSVVVENSPATSSCTIERISAITSGFSIRDANVPLTVGANQNETLSFTVVGPAGGYYGNLTVDVE